MVGEIEQPRLRGRPTTEAVLAGDYALSIGRPDRKAPTDWRWVSLLSVARLESGHTPSRRHPEYWGGDIPWVGITDATKNDGRVLYSTNENTNPLGIANSAARVLPAGTVCLSRTASVGYVVILGQPMATSQDFVNWICGPEIDKGFLKYVLLSERRALRMFSSGTTHQTIYFPEVKAFHICLPSLREQERIADLLGSLDDKIELNRRMTETLEATARALFRSWFVHFEPVAAKAEGRSTNLSNNIDALFPSKFQEHGVPEQWPSTNYELADVERTSVQPSQVPPETPYVGLEHIDSRSLFLTRNGYAPDVESLKTRFIQGDILFGKLRPYFHKVVIAPFDGICSSDILVFRPRKGVPVSFLALAFSEKAFVDMASNASGGTRMPRADWGYLQAQPTVRPSDQLLSMFHAAVGPGIERAQAAQEESRTLAALRNTLLPKLISGQMRIRDAERFVTVA